MATEHEVDRLVVRLVGNQVEYQKMLKDVEKQTEDTAKWAEARGNRITKAFSAAFRGAGSLASQTGMGAMGASAAISAPMAKGAMEFSSQGKEIKEIVIQFEKAAKAAAEMKKSVMQGTEAFKELGKNIKITEYQASVFKVMSERTGMSIEDLVKNVGIGSAEFEKWRREAEKLGLTMSKEDVDAANALAESWLRVKQAMSGMWGQIGAIVSKRFEEWNKLIAGIITGITKWIRENKGLIDTIATVGEKLMYIGGILVVVGTALTTIASVMGPLIAGIAAGAAAWLAWDTATGRFLRGGAVDIWERYADGIKNAMATVIEYGSRIMAYTEKIISGVSNALKAGNFELAVKIVWEGVKVAWIKGLLEIDKLTGEKMGGLFKNLAAGNWKNAMEVAINEVLILWEKLLSKMDSILTLITNTMATAWTAIVNTFEAAISMIMNLLTTAAQKLAVLAAAVPGGGGLSESLLEFGGQAFNPQPKTRERETEQANAARQVALLGRQLEYAKKIEELEVKRALLIIAGEAAAAEALKTQQASLEASLKQAEAEKAAADAAQANGEATRQRAEAAKQASEIALKIEQEKQSIVERYDPVQKYMRQLKELNALFKESERSGSVYKKALRDLRQELGEEFRVQVKFGAIGMEAVRKGTTEDMQLIQASMEEQAKKAAEKRALEEVDKKQRELDEREGAPTPSEDMAARSVALLIRVAEAIERLASKGVIEFFNLGAAP